MSANLASARDDKRVTEPQPGCDSRCQLERVPRASTGDIHVRPRTAGRVNSEPGAPRSPGRQYGDSGWWRSQAIDASITLTCRQRPPSALVKGSLADRHACLLGCWL